MKPHKNHHIESCSQCLRGKLYKSRDLYPTFSLSELSNRYFLQISPCSHDLSREVSHAVPLSTLTSSDHSATGMTNGEQYEMQFPVATSKIKHRKTALKMILNILDHEIWFRSYISGLLSLLKLDKKLGILFIYLFVYLSFKFFYKHC